MSSISGVLLSGLSTPKAPTLPWPPRVIKEKKPSEQVLEIIRAHFLSVGNIQMPRKAKNTHTHTETNQPPRCVPFLALPFLMSQSSHLKSWILSFNPNTLLRCIVNHGKVHNISWENTLNKSAGAIINLHADCMTTYHFV